MTEATRETLMASLLLLTDEINAADRRICRCRDGYLMKIERSTLTQLHAARNSVRAKIDALETAQNAALAVAHITAPIKS